MQIYSCGKPAYVHNVVFACSSYFVRSVLGMTKFYWFITVNDSTWLNLLYVCLCYHRRIYIYYTQYFWSLSYSYVEAKVRYILILYL